MYEQCLITPFYNLFSKLIIILIIFNISIALFTIEDQKRFTKNILK